MKNKTNWFNQMSLPKKLGYIWDYYKIHLLSTLGVILLLLIWFFSALANNKKVTLYLLIFNDQNNIKLVENIKRDYPKFLGNDNVFVNADNGYVFNTYVNEYGLNWPDDSASIKITSFMLNSEADVIISDYPSMLFGVYKEFCSPLEEMLSKDLYEQLEPYYVYAKFKDSNENNDGPVYGLDISDTEFYKKNKNAYEDAILCIPNVTLHPLEAEQFVKFIFGID